MKKSLLVILSSLLFALPAVAGDAKAGKAKSQSCAACHGADGNSAAPTFPKLAGQNEKYLIKQMNDIKSGVRPVPTMAGQLDNMSAQDIADIAAYFASQNGSVGQANADLAKKGEAIYRGGIIERNIPACTGCHSPAGEGNAAAGFPMLSGQHAAYTEAQLKSFRAAADGDSSGRMNDGEETKTMRTIAFQLSDNEIKALAAYIQGLY
ncbi:cytochrome c [Litorivivens sp.]|uniref:c-type cytochrome n=2 Tax=Litorivivens sp. TaxID=2020868 RepID=UPI0035638D56